MKGRQWKVLWVGTATLFILFLIGGIIVVITALVTSLTLSSIAGLLFDKREDDVNKEV